MSAKAYSGAMLDTSVWIAVMEDAKVVDGLADVQRDLPTLTSPIVLAEIASLGARGRFSPQQAVDDVAERTRLEPLTPEDAVAAGLLHGKLRSQGHEKVGLGDCLIYATSQRVGALMITCDTDLAKQADVALLTARKPRRRAS